MITDVITFISVSSIWFYYLLGVKSSIDIYQAILIRLLWAYIFDYNLELTFIESLAIETLFSLSLIINGIILVGFYNFYKKYKNYNNYVLGLVIGLGILFTFCQTYKIKALLVSFIQ